MLRMLGLLEIGGRDEGDDGDVGEHDRGKNREKVEERNYKPKRRFPALLPIQADPACTMGSMHRTLSWNLSRV